MLRLILGHQHLRSRFEAACHGPALPAITIAATVAGTALSAVGQMQAGQATASQAAYQAGVARNNSILAKRAADDARARGKADELKKRIDTRRLIGRQRAQLAANGVLVDAGSALDIVADTAMIGEVDALTIRSNAEREALNYEAQGANFSSDADLLRMKQRQALSDGMWGAGTTALSGLGQVASKWYSFNQEGVSVVP